MSEIRAVTAETGRIRSSFFTVSFRAFAMREIQPKAVATRCGGVWGAFGGSAPCYNIDGTTLVLEGNLGKPGRWFLNVKTWSVGRQGDWGRGSNRCLRFARTA